MHLEMDKLRAIESLRQEYNALLEREKQQVDRERERADSWIADLREQFRQEKQKYEEKISELESKLCAQEETSSEQRAVGAGEGEELRRLHYLQPAAYRSSVEGYIQQPARMETGTRYKTAQEGTLPEVRENVNSYPCHDFEHWGTLPPRLGGRIGMQEVCPRPLVTFVPRRDHHSRDTLASTISEANPNPSTDYVNCTCTSCCHTELAITFSLH